MSSVADELDAVAVEVSFSGVVRIDRQGRVELERAYGHAHRGFGIPNTVDTRFAIASGTKAFTALVVVGLIEEGRLELGTSARSILRDDLPLIDEAVTVEHLLSHRSGIGDYLDEEADLDLNDYLMPVPVHELAETERYLTVLDGHPMKFAPGTRFGYCNSGYVVLALIAERTTGRLLPELVAERVCERAGMVDTAFLRSDEPDGRTALGYPSAAGLRTNVLHLPVRGTGDGGLHTTLSDISAFWRELFGGKIVSRRWVEEMTVPRHEGSGDESYGLGFWLDPANGVVTLKGCDAGISFRSAHRPATGQTLTVISNTTEGAWPVARRLSEIVEP
jgi:CubicO group peptidase (beta-lactamase class C family)